MEFSLSPAPSWLQELTGNPDYTRDGITAIPKQTTLQKHCDHIVLPNILIKHSSKSGSLEASPCQLQVTTQLWRVAVKQSYCFVLQNRLQSVLLFIQDVVEYVLEAEPLMTAANTHHLRLTKC